MLLFTTFIIEIYFQPIYKLIKLYFVCNINTNCLQFRLTKKKDGTKVVL